MIDAVSFIFLGPQGQRKLVIQSRELTNIIGLCPEHSSVEPDFLWHHHRQQRITKEKHNECSKDQKRSERDVLGTIAPVEE